ncbi:MAG: DUF2062 domain-containing protein [bacterium]|nr:DUF2062 domain-containing protein [bacterium]
MFESFTRSLKTLVDDKILRHFRESHHPIEELGMASAVGLFWALTPLVGFQMLLVTANWVLFRAFRLHFHLVIGVAWVWLSNPFTMVPMYYSFYITGYYFFSILGYAIEPISAATFGVVLDEASALGMTQGLIHWMKFMIYQLGWPMLIGGFVLGVPASIAGYPITVYFVRRFRMRSARQLGISYEEWEERFVLHRGEVARSGPGVENSHEFENGEVKARAAKTPEEPVQAVRDSTGTTKAAGSKARKSTSKKKAARRAANPKKKRAAS